MGIVPVGWFCCPILTVQKSIESLERCERRDVSAAESRRSVAPVKRPAKESKGRLLPTSIHAAVHSASYQGYTAEPTYILMAGGGDTETFTSRFTRTWDSNIPGRSQPDLERAKVVIPVLEIRI